MAIKVGDRIPKATLKRLTPEGMKDINTEEYFKGRKVVLFAVPGAFTPTCSAKHLPGYVEQAEKIKAKGADEIACVSVNDAFVMDSWGKDRNVSNKVTMLADGNAGFHQGPRPRDGQLGLRHGPALAALLALIEDSVVKTARRRRPASSK
jgi:peroxiredoxin